MKTTFQKYLLIWSGMALVHVFGMCGNGYAATLQSLRIGEHDGFTRVVFEFAGSLDFDISPAINNEDVTVMLSDTTTELPPYIDCVSTERIHSIHFAKMNSDLAVRIHPFRTVQSVRSFSLLEPNRVVVDLYHNARPPSDAQKPGSPSTNLLFNEGERARVLFEKAVSLQRQGKKERAKALYLAALKYAPKMASALNNLGAIYISEGDFPSARDLLEKAITFNPDYVDAYYNLACLHALRNKRAASLLYLRRAIHMSEHVRGWARNDPDLENIRSHPEFKRLVGMPANF